VWYPNSPFKTAQAISDMDREGLPLFIFANWRGFSGGMRDMYDEVLKYGAMIVDSLRVYSQPVFIYLPPHGELRGGAWVVVDPTINPDHMEMYADELSRGGVLEPEGTVEIKYRRKDILKTMERLDHTYRTLLQKTNSPDLTALEKKTLEGQLRAREEHLASTYHQIAVTFADLHDTPGRMQEKGVVKDVLKWRDSRQFFYWRLRRRLSEEVALRIVMDADSSISRGEAMELLKRWFVEDKGTVNTFLWHQDQVAVSWLEQQVSSPSSAIRQNAECVKKEYLLRQLHNLITSHPQVTQEAIVHISQQLSPQQRTQVMRLLSNVDRSSDRTEK
jgi:hypothetical protein